MINKLRKLKPEEIGDGEWCVSGAPSCLEGWLGYFVYDDPSIYESALNRDLHYYSFLDFIQEVDSYPHCLDTIFEFNDHVPDVVRAEVWNAYVDHCKEKNEQEDN